MHWPRLRGDPATAKSPPRAPFGSGCGRIQHPAGKVNAVVSAAANRFPGQAMIAWRFARLAGGRARQPTRQLQPAAGVGGKCHRFTFDKLGDPARGYRTGLVRLASPLQTRVARRAFDDAVGQVERSFGEQRVEFLLYAVEPRSSCIS